MSEEKEPCITLPLSRARKIVPRQKKGMGYSYYYYNTDEPEKLQMEIVELVKKNEEA